jgi:hypothetical protein
MNIQEITLCIIGGASLIYAGYSVIHYILYKIKQQKTRKYFRNMRNYKR